MNLIILYELEVLVKNTTRNTNVKSSLSKDLSNIQSLFLKNIISFDQRINIRE